MKNEEDKYKWHKINEEGFPISNEKVEVLSYSYLLEKLHWNLTVTSYNKEEKRFYILDTTERFKEIPVAWRYYKFPNNIAEELNIKIDSNE